jgi:hypothetical protein
LSQKFDRIVGWEQQVDKTKADLPQEMSKILHLGILCIWNVFKRGHWQWCVHCWRVKGDSFGIRENQTDGEEVLHSPLCAQLWPRFYQWNTTRNQWIGPQLHITVWLSCTVSYYRFTDCHCGNAASAMSLFDLSSSGLWV